MYIVKFFPPSLEIHYETPYLSYFLIDYEPISNGIFMNKIVFLSEKDYISSIQAQINN